MSPSSQLGLPFPEVADFAAADFVEAPSNGEALAWLRRSESWPEGRLVVWGARGCGKTHLLHVWQAGTGATWQSAALLQGLPEVPEFGGVAVDDADAVADEASLLHLLNAAAERRLPVLLSASAAPTNWQLALPDLASRIRAAHAVQILPPDDTLLRVLLARCLHARQLAVPESLQDWLRLRLPRTPAAMAAIAARLDEAALAAKTAITRGLAARVIERMQGLPSREVDELSDSEEAGSPKKAVWGSLRG